MVGLADLKKHFENVKKCHMSLSDKYCYFSLSGVNTLDFLDIVNYKSWVYKTFQKMVNIRYVYIIKKLQSGNTIVRTSVGFAPLLLRYLRIKGYHVRDEDIEVFKARNIVFPDLKITLYDFQNRMVNDWLAAGGIGVVKCPTGGGKCCKDNTLILTDRGLIKIEDIVHGISDSTNKDKDTGQLSLYDSIGMCDDEFKSFNEENIKSINNIISISQRLKYESYKISGKYDMGISDVITLKTSMGYEISGTPEHKIVVIDNNGNLNFKRLENITDKDYIAISYGTNIFNARLELHYHFRPSKFDSNSYVLKNIGHMNNEIARLIGYVIAEGSCISSDDTEFLSITNYDKETIDDIIKICENIGAHARCDYDEGKNQGNPIGVKISSKMIIGFMYYLGYRHGAKNKEIPWSILQADKESQISFIKSIFDCDGTVYHGESEDSVTKRVRTKSLVEYYSSSYELCRQLQIMLLNIGIISRLNPKKGVSLEYRGEIRNYDKSYRLSINGGEILKFAKIIGFGISRKKEILDRCIEDLESRDRWTDIIYPNIYKKLKVLHERLKLMGQRGEIIKRWEEDFDIGNKCIKINRKKSVSLREYLISHDFNKPMWAYISGERYPSKETLEKILRIMSPVSDMIEHKYLRTLSERFIFDNIDNIKKEKERVYDITVDNAHSYIGNGIVNHNTILACSMIKQIARKTLILVHTSDLLINVWNDSLIKSFGQGIMGQVGIIGGGLTDKDRAAMRLGVRSGDFDENVRKDIVIATFQTLMNRMDDLTQYKFGLMIVDECIPIDSEIWTQDGVVQYDDLGYGQDYKREVFGVWSRNNEDNIVNNGYKKIKTRMKHMYRTIVESGDELVCSLDHKVLTRKNDGKEEFIEIENAKNIARSLVKPYDMRKDSILARAFGYILGDGWVDINIDSGAGGDYEGLTRLQNDLKKLNYRSNIGKERELDSTINSISSGIISVHGSVHSIKFEKRFSDLLIKLGHPIGRKTNQVYYIPDWIMNGDIDVKREFIAGYLGAEGSNPGFRGSGENKLKKSFFVPRFSFNKRIDLIDKGLGLANQFKKLLKDLDIDVSDISIVDGNIRKDGTISKKIVITIGNQVDNLRKYLDVGYRYCHNKEKEGESIRLFLRYIDQCDQERDDVQDEIRKLYDKGIKKRNRIVAIMNSRSSSQKTIMSSWGMEEDDKIIIKKCLVPVTDGMVSDILYPHKNEDGTDKIAKTVAIKKGMHDFDDWMKKIKGDFIFLDILRHEYREYEQGYTLTVNNDHNYLVNGFNVKNCHHCPAQMFRKVNAVIRAPYKLGLSATIDRLDGMTRDVFGQLGDVQTKVSIRELINRGILAEPRFQSPIIVDHDAIADIQDSGLSGLNYSRFVKKKSAASQKKKDYIVNICKNIAARDRKFLLFTDYVNAEDVFVRDNYAESLSSEGVSVTVIDQGMASDERSSVFNFLETGEISGIVFGKLGSEGVNIPSVDVVVMANAIKSPITFTQRVGRTMRRVPGKDFCDVYEVLLDLPTEMRWSDFNFAEYRAEGFQKLVYKVD